MAYVLFFLLLVIVFISAIFYVFFDSMGWGWLSLIIAGIIFLSRWRDTAKESEKVDGLRAEEERQNKQGADWLKHREKENSEKVRHHEERLQKLLEKYADEQLARKLWCGKIWLEQTEEQLLDALGPPAKDVSKETARSSREVWMYAQIRKNAYALKVTLTDGVVSKIDDKR